MEELNLPKPKEEKELPAPEEKLLMPPAPHHKHLLLMRIIGIAFLVSLPFVGFYLGMQYQKSLTPITIELPQPK